MRRDILVALLVTAVLGDVVQVVSADDQRPVHLGGDDGASQDASTDRDEAGEGALLVCRANVELVQKFRSSFSQHLLHPPKTAASPASPKTDPQANPRLPVPS